MAKLNRGKWLVSGCGPRSCANRPEHLRGKLCTLKVTELQESDSTFGLQLL